MRSEDKMIAILFSAMFLVIAIGIACQAYVDAERARHGCTEESK